MDTITHYKDYTQSLSPERKQIPDVQLIRYKKGEKKEETLSFTGIILVTKGSIILSYDHFFDRPVSEGKMILLPPGCHFTLRTEETAEAFIFRFFEALDFMPDHSFNDIIEQMPLFINEMNYLEINTQITAFLSFIKTGMQNGLSKEDYLRLKAKELLCLLQCYYKQEQLIRFFFPLLTANGRFHNFVLSNYRKVKTVKQFAELYNCSVSNFDKKFHQTFGTSTYQWMQQQKIKLLYHEINATDKPLRQIAKEQNFLSLPQFNDYCKKHFGYPPGKMRRLSKMFKTERKQKMDKIDV